MLPPEETNFDLVVQNSVTPSLNLTWNLGQKDPKYLVRICVCGSNLFLQNVEDQIQFNGSYNQLRDKPTFGAPDYYETIHFFPDKIDFDGGI